MGTSSGIEAVTFLVLIFSDTDVVASSSESDVSSSSSFDGNIFEDLLEI